MDKLKMILKEWAKKDREDLSNTQAEYAKGFYNGQLVIIDFVLTALESEKNKRRRDPLFALSTFPPSIFSHFPHFIFKGGLLWIFQSVLAYLLTGFYILPQTAKKRRSLLLTADGAIMK